MEPKKFVCIGDSITAGYGIQTKDRWTNLLTTNLNIDVINSGISGDTTAGMLARFNEMVIKFTPSFVIITGGTNDLSFNLPYNTIVANIVAMTRHAKHHGIVPIIGIPTPFFDPNHLNNAGQLIDGPSLSERIGSFQNKLKQHAIKDDQYYIDFSLQMHSELFLEDGLHPNKKGHEVMCANAKLSLDRIFE